MQKIFDTIGLTSSGICSIHCLYAPVSLILVPLFGVSILDVEIFHEAILYFILPSALIAITMGCRKHKDYRVALLAVTGITILLYATLHHESLQGTLELITLTGSLFLVVSHFTNFILCQKAGCTHNHH